jgi:hypothetical protein
LKERLSSLILSEGASLEFIMAPYNLMKEGGKAAILIQEHGQPVAIKEANFEKPLSLLLQQLKTTIIFQKDMHTYRC